ncbi:hypothetical protein HYU09_05210 [Candidatus Woesearchaeota archaeon]|nr:hypothetical protein [Candidatus Woesearchaeota archaeon]
MENIPNSPNMEDYMLEKKFEIMLDMNNRKIANEINKLSSMISHLTEEIASIKRGMGSATAKAERAVAVEEPLESGAREIPSNSVRPKPNEDIKPRFGDYSPEDVPIGKIFYFGNKKAR